MINSLVGFYLGKLAKEKGFDEYCINNFNVEGKPSSFTGYDIMKKYHKNSSIHNCDTNTEDFEYPDLLCTRPSQSLVKKWLWEIHGIFVSSDYYTGYSEPRFYYNIKIKGDDVYNGNQDGDESIYTYEEALEMGLIEGLNLIKNIDLL